MPVPDSYFLSLRDGMSAEAATASRWTALDERTTVSFPDLSPAVLGALAELWPGGAYEEALLGAVRGAEGAQAVQSLTRCLRRLDEHGVLLRSVWTGDTAVATLVPRSPFTFPHRTIAAGHRRRISRFAYTRRVGRALTVSSPRSRAVVLLDDARAAALIGALAEPATVPELVAGVGSLPAGTVALVLCLLDNAGLLAPPGEGAVPEEDDPVLGSWSFHDLLFHVHRRLDGAHRPAGMAHRPTDTARPHPRRPAARRIRLERPDPGVVRHEDPPFARVQETRCSIRVHGSEPLTVRQLGHFLHRTAGRGIREAGMPDALSVYPVVHACRGLDTGLYRYEPEDHVLARLGERTPDVEQLLRDAAESVRLPGRPPQVLLVLTARPCTGVPYGQLLRQVGAVYQQMYLVATAMGLAPCALDCGDADAFGRAAGTDYCGEPSVGEFLLGSSPVDPLPGFP